MRSSGTMVVCLSELLSSASHRTRSEHIAHNMTQNGHMTIVPTNQWPRRSERTSHADTQHVLQLMLHIKSPEETHQRNVAVDRRGAMVASKTASPPINVSPSVMKSKAQEYLGAQSSTSASDDSNVSSVL